MGNETAQPPAGVAVLAIIVFTVIIALVIIVPLWKIFKKTGKNPAWSIFVILPFPIGFWIVCLILAFSKWPAIQSQISVKE